VLLYGPLLCVAFGEMTCLTRLCPGRKLLIAYGGKLRFLTPFVGRVRAYTGVGVTVGVGYAADCETKAALADAASVEFVTSKASGYL
jgi:hypothetical protein